MNLEGTLALMAGGPGSGCNPAAGDCGRKKGFTTFYHGTTAKAAEKIKKQGLVPGHPSPYSDLTSNRKGKVYLTLTPQRGKFYAYQTSIQRKSSPAVVKFKIPNKLADKFEEDWLDRSKNGRSFTYNKAIPAKHVVSVLTPDKMQRSGWRDGAMKQAISEVKRAFR